jgi:hypothetical protein
LAADIDSGVPGVGLGPIAVQVVLLDAHLLGNLGTREAGISLTSAKRTLELEDFRGLGDFDVLIDRSGPVVSTFLSMTRAKRAGPGWTPDPIVQGLP